MIYNHENLQWQYDWRGTQLQNLRVLVGPDELDKPQRQLGTIILPPDPVSLINARPEQYNIDESAGPIFTYLAADALAGTRALVVQSVTGFAVSNFILVELANGQFAEATINTIDSVNNVLNILIPLPVTAPSGGTVTVSALVPAPPP